MKKINSNITRHKGKGSSPLLPSRNALDQLTAGEAFNQSINNYAKVTPSGGSALNAPSVLAMSQIKY
jgi:hypothetical protein